MDSRFTTARQGKQYCLYRVPLNAAHRKPICTVPVDLMESIDRFASASEFITTPGRLGVAPGRPSLVGRYT
jgi:hypothetical protein